MSDRFTEEPSARLVGEDVPELVLNADQVHRLLRLMKLAGEDPDALAGS